MLNAPFCPIKQKLRKNECEVSMVKIPQHKVTKWGKFFRGSFPYFLSNPTKIFIAAVYFWSDKSIKRFGEEGREYKNIRQLNSCGLTPNKGEKHEF